MNGRDKLLLEALAAAKKHGYEGIFILPTGSGKARLMIEIAKILNPKNILYLCNTTLLRDKTFLDEVRKWGADYLIPRMELACYQTACKWQGRHFDLVLGDEFDAALTPIYIKAFTNNTFGKKVLVSATLDADKLRKAKKIAPTIFERTPLKLIEDKVLNKVKFYFVNYNLTAAENGFYLNYNLQFKKLLNQFRTKEVERKLEMLQIQRKQFLSKLDSSLKVTKWLIDNLSKRNEKILVFCGLSEQADRVCKHSYHSGNNDEKLINDFDAGIIKLLAVVNKVDRGLNIDQIRNIIFESTGRSKTRITQRIGRGMRLDVEDTLNVFFLIPHYLDAWGNRKATIVQQWILDSTEDMDLTGVKTITYKL